MTAPATQTVPLAEFLEATRLELCERASGLLAPQYTSDLHRPAADTLAHLHGRPFLSAQVDVAAALKLALSTHGNAFCIGEQGTGKSQMALGTAALLRAQRVLVLTPPHLVSNWERKEIRPVWPEAHVTTLRTLADLRALPTLPTPLFALLSREPAKLGPIFTPAVVQRRLRHRFEPTDPFPTVWACPNCYAPVLDDKEHYLQHPSKAPSHCVHKRCRAALWTVKHRNVHVGPAPARVPLARHILRTLPGFFDLLIIDELHEYQGQDTLQGEAMGHLVEACGAVLGLTGTLFNGYASSLFPILWRTHREIQQQFAFHSHSKWITQYGLWDKRTRVIPDTTTGTTNGPPRTKTKRDVRERPGASPALLIPFLDRTAFVRMKDLHQHLPPYTEDVLSVEMTTAQRQAYGRLQSTLTAAIQQAISRKAWNRVGLYMTTLMTWPDRCWISEPAQFHAKFQEDSLELPPVLPPGQSYPKEKLLLELIHRERAARRKVLVYVTHTGTRDLTARLHHLCEQEGLRCNVLTTKVKPEARLDWLETHTPDLDVLISQPRLVATGFTLNDYPTIVFAEPDYSIYTLRQASRRSWRLNQTKPVKVYFLSYMHTAQEQAWGLVARKLKASLLIEGDLDQTSDGLASFQEEGDFLVELAKQITQAGSEQATPDSLRALFNQCREIEGLPSVPASVANPDPTPTPEPVATVATIPPPAEPNPVPVRVPRFRVKAVNPFQLELF